MRRPGAGVEPDTPAGRDREPLDAAVRTGQELSSTGCATGRLTAETTALRDAVVMDESIPTPHTT